MQVVYNQNKLFNAMMKTRTLNSFIYFSSIP